MIISERNIAVIEIGESGTAAMIVDQLRNQNQKVERYFSDVDVSKYTEGKYNCIVMYKKTLYLASYDFENAMPALYAA